jgi:ankyrin repeat protein
MDVAYGASLAASMIRRQKNKSNHKQTGIFRALPERHTTGKAEVIRDQSCIHDRKLTHVVYKNILQHEDTHIDSIISKEQRAIFTNNLALLQQLIEKNDNILTQNDLCFIYNGETVKTTLLGYACMCKNLSSVKYLISQQANINAMDEEGYTPLHRAVSSLKIVKYLLNNGADPKIVSDNGHSVNALGATLMENYTQVDKSLEQTEIAKALLKFNNEMLSTYCYKTFYPLEAVAQLKSSNTVSTIMERYRKEKIDIPVANMHLYSLLHSTCAADKLTDVKHQVKCKKRELSKCEFTNYMNQTSQGKTPLHLACENGNKDIIKYLLKNGADIYKPDFNGLTPLEILLKNSSTIESFKLIIDNIPKKDLDKPLFNGSSVFSLAIKYNNDDLCNLLINKREDLLKKYLEKENTNLENNSPTTDTATTGTSKKVAFGYVERRDLKTGKQLNIVQLINNKAEIIAKNKYGKTPLELAFTEYTATNNSSSLDKLFRYISNIDESICGNETLLMYAIRIRNPDLVKYLVNVKGASYFI